MEFVKKSHFIFHKCREYWTGVCLHSTWRLVSLFAGWRERRPDDTNAICGTEAELAALRNITPTF